MCRACQHMLLDLYVSHSVCVQALLKFEAVLFETANFSFSMGLIAAQFKTVYQPSLCAGRCVWPLSSWKTQDLHLKLVFWYWVTHFALKMSHSSSGFITALIHSESPVPEGAQHDRTSNRVFFSLQAMYHYLYINIHFISKELYFTLSCL